MKELTHTIQDLKDRVVEIQQTPDDKLAEEVLEKFEEIARSHFNVLGFHFNQESKKSSYIKDNWFYAVEKLDQSLGNDKGPDRPWTRVFCKTILSPYNWCYTRFRNDLRMIGSRLRHEDEMDAMLDIYLKPLREFSDLQDIMELILENVSVEIDDGTTIFVPDTYYYEDQGGELELDWDKVDIVYDGISQTIDTIVEECVLISKKQCSLACSWRLTEFLLCIGAGDRLWNMIVDHIFKDKELPLVGYRAWYVYTLLDMEDIPEYAFEIVPQDIREMFRTDKESLQFHAKYLIQFKILIKSVEYLVKKVNSLLTFEDESLITPGLISSSLKVEIEVCLLNSLDLRYLGTVLFTILPTEEKEERLGNIVDSLLIDLFKGYQKIKQTNNHNLFAIQQEIPVPTFWILKESAQFMKRALPLINTVDEFRVLLTNPKEFLQKVEKRPFVLSKAQAEELGLPEGTDLRGEYIKRDEKLQETIEAFESEKDNNKALKELVQEFARTDIDKAREQIIKFEGTWCERVRNYYKLQGHKNEKQMFEDLLKAIKNPQFQKQNLRGKIDGDFGEGHLFFSDIKYFLDRHWNHFKNLYFEDWVNLYRLKKTLERIGHLRNVLSHAQESPDKQKKAAREILVILDKFENLLKKRRSNEKYS